MVKAAVQKHQFSNVLRGDRLLRIREDLLHLTYVFIFRSLGGQTCAVSLVYKSNLNHLHHVVQTDGFYNYTFARNYLDHIFEHQSI